MKNKKSLRKKYSVKKKKPLLENNFLTGLFFFFCFGLGGLYFFVFYPFFQVDSVIIEEKSQELLAEDMLAYVEGSLLFLNTKSIFLVSGGEIEKRILKDAPEIKEVSLKRKFPATIIIESQKRRPDVVWCKNKEKKDCYYVDRGGTSFREANAQGTGLIIFVKGKDFTIGEKVIEEDFLESFHFLKRAFQREGIETDYFTISSVNTVELITHEGWAAYFFKRNIEEGVENIRLVLEELDEEKREEIEYIDLRFGDRIYYK